MKAFIEIRDDGYFYVCYAGKDVYKTIYRSKAEQVKNTINIFL